MINSTEGYSSERNGINTPLAFRIHHSEVCSILFSRDPAVQSTDLLFNTYTVLFLSSLSFFPLLNCVFWDHLPNKLLAPKFLFQGPLLWEPVLKQVLSDSRQLANPALKHKVECLVGTGQDRSSNTSDMLSW